MVEPTQGSVGKSKLKKIIFTQASEEYFHCAVEKEFTAVMTRSTFRGRFYIMTTRVD